MLAGVVVFLVATNVVAHFTGHWAGIVAVPLAAVLLVAATRLAGLRWREMGLSRSELRAGVPYAVAAVVVVFAVVSVAVAIPATRQFFLSDRYDSASEAALAALVVIPLQTVLPEELLFRGILQGTLARLFGVRATLGLGALAFGLWHISSSLGLTSGNAGLSGVLGSGTLGQVAGILGAVVATAAAGLVLGWLRYRADSLLAPIALHWALNAIGAIGAAVAWQLPS
ncbi:CPBP family intramembrane glutamic endopeptidase [Gordonia sp. SID5947]|uniref:CPBP family intramembrane glutamic endopeptidase n=1 Tax=Gordonia sp. SID5947 TaxID=2690315 RepID=UPI001F3FEB0C|nr:CPBP family intramembrane glutamic endopeptidase [Gordonia sp. SID5947]